MPAANPNQIIIIDIEDETIQTNPKKGGGTYETQYGYLHEIERDGTPKRVRREVRLFPPKVEGRAIPFKKGSYTLGARSVQAAANGFLELGFVSLVPLPAGAKV